MHRLLSQHLDHLVRLNGYEIDVSANFEPQAPPRDDTLRIILAELDGVPTAGSDELNEARDTAIELQLSNRFAKVKGNFSLVCQSNFDSYAGQIPERMRKLCGCRRSARSLRSSAFSQQRTLWSR